ARFVCGRFSGLRGGGDQSAPVGGWVGPGASRAGLFAPGTLLSVGPGAVPSAVPRRYFTVQRVLFAVAVAGLAVIAVVMLVGTRSGFSSSLTSLTGLRYNQVIATAEKHGFVAASTSLRESWKVLILPLHPLPGAVQSVDI